MKKKIIIFDFDGVIIDSVKIKDNAFKSLVAKYPKKIRNAFFKFHKKNIGKSRFIKFEYLFKNLLKIPYTQRDIKLMSEAFAKIVLYKIARINLNKGVLKFLVKNKVSFLYFISSGTPQRELKRIIHKKCLNIYFKKIYGSPVDKVNHILDIIKTYKFLKKDILFIGDGLSDLKAAMRTNINFIQFGNSFKSNKIKYKIKNFFELEKLIKKKF